MKKIQNLVVLLTVFLLMSACGAKKDTKTYGVINTSFGEMKFFLYESTPLHKENFIKLAKEGFYDELLFHRVIEGFMAQGGDPNSRGAAPEKRLGSGGPGYLIDNEIGAPHLKGTLSAARTGSGNPEKKSSGSQFFVVQGKKQTEPMLKQMEAQKGITYNEQQRGIYKELGGAPFLDMDYTVFGEIVTGFDVLDAICAEETAPGDRPLKDIKMTIKILD